MYLFVANNNYSDSNSEGYVILFIISWCRIIFLYDVCACVCMCLSCNERVYLLSLCTHIHTECDGHRLQVNFASALLIFFVITNVVI